MILPKTLVMNRSKKQVMFMMMACIVLKMRQPHRHRRKCHRFLQHFPALPKVAK